MEGAIVKFSKSTLFGESNLIFVTVGISQPFDRLINEVDRIAHKINEPIFAQIGRTYYEPANIKYKRFLSGDELNEQINGASLIITHGGFGSIFHVLSNNKPLIAVPKTFELDETDNDQTELVQFLEKEGKLLGVYDIDRLYETIVNYKLSPPMFEYNLEISKDIEEQLKKWFNK